MISRGEGRRWENLGKKGLRRKLVEQAEKFGSILERIAHNMELDFRCDLKNKNYVEFGSGSRMATFKIQVNFVEKLLFSSRDAVAKTLLTGREVSDEDKAYFREFLEFYQLVEVSAYSIEEILCEKMRAILTRQAMKLRDIYDVFMIWKAGVRIEELKEEILEKIRSAMRFKKYRDALKASVDTLSLESILEDPAEMEMFVVKPGEEFYSFAGKLERFLKEVAREVSTK